MLIGVMIPPFTKRAQRRIVQHPKFFFFDADVFRAIRPMGLLDSPQEIDGPALETLVMQHLRAHIDQSRKKIQLFYWRTSTGLEVDFVLYGVDGFCAIEIKRSSTVSRNDLRGLTSFTAEYPEAKPMLIYGGDREQVLEGIPLVPLCSFLENCGRYTGTETDARTS